MGILILSGILARAFMRRRLDAVEIMFDARAMAECVSKYFFNVSAEGVVLEYFVMYIVTCDFMAGKVFGEI